MSLIGNLVFVFLAGMVTALATGVGALPFYFSSEINDRLKVGLWGLASGIMIAASVFGLLTEATAYGTYLQIGVGVGCGVVLVILADWLLQDAEIDPGEYEEADFRKLVLILGILTVHSFPEGVAVGVSFAELGLDGGTEFLGFTLPLLGITMTVAIAIHNIPEGLSIGIPLRNMGVAPRRMVGWAIFSSLPQPIGAVLAFVFVSIAQQLLPTGFGFAAGAMIFLVATEFVPEALKQGAHLPSHGYLETATGFISGIILMLPFLLI
jgi:Predicted divalent heavy-metal cations transporter